MTRTDFIKRRGSTQTRALGHAYPGRATCKCLLLRKPLFPLIFPHSCQDGAVPCRERRARHRVIMETTSSTVALAIVGLFPAVAVLVAVFAQSKTIAAFAQLGGLRERTHARTQWTADHPSPLTRLGRALGREARGGTGRVRSAAGHARVCHLCGREGDPSLA